MQWPREDLKSVVPTPLRYVEAFERQPGLGSAQRPMHICIGYDEYSPGTQFNIDNSKKVMCLYMNFRELDCMADSCTWFTPLVVRARRADDVKGGWSAMLSWFLKHMLCGPHGLKTVGISFSYGNRDHLFFSVLGNVLSDGDGIRKGYGWRGHASLKPCTRHLNIMRKDSDLASRLNDYYEITCCDHSKMIVASRQDFEDSCDMVASPPLMDWLCVDSQSGCSQSPPLCWDCDVHGVT